MNFTKYTLHFLLFVIVGSALAMQESDIHELTITNHQINKFVRVLRKIPYEVINSMNARNDFIVNPSKSYDTIARIFPGETQTIRVYLAGKGNWIKITSGNSIYVRMGKHSASQEILIFKKFFDEESKQKKLETIKVNSDKKTFTLVVNSHGIINFIEKSKL